MATTVEIPFELDTVDPTNGNAFWTNQNTRFWYQGVYRFARTGSPGPIAGRGYMSWKCGIPKNLAGTPAWNVVLHHANASGDQGAVLLRAEAAVLASGDTPAAMTVLVPNNLIGVDVSGDQNLTVLSGTNFDALLALTAGNRLNLVLMRMPGVSGDTLIGGWDLVMPPMLRVDVV